jgi:lipopolysaccharide export system permease protein
MKKLDKLIISSFIGPFILTFLVVVFILLMQHMLRYFDDIIGKDLGWDVVGQLLFYFAVFMVPVAMPLAVLLSSLITFGNLGEHFELTAIKASGISLLRTLQPIFFFVVMLTLIAFYVNNNMVPKAALEAYSLLYDIKQKKPALELQEGTFYNGINDFSIKVDQKFPEDEAALKKIVLYDHRGNDGNKDVTIADSGRMTTIMNERYLKFELFNGYNYAEGAGQEQSMTGQTGRTAETLRRSHFKRTQMIFDLSSFELSRTDKKWFQGNRIMRNLNELDHDIDSLNREVLQQRLNYYLYKPTFFSYHSKVDELIMPQELEAFKRETDSITRVKHITEHSDTLDSAELRKPVLTRPKAYRFRKNHMLLSQRKAFKSDSVKKTPGAVAGIKGDSLFSLPPTKELVQAATNMARNVKSQFTNANASIETYNKELVIFEIQWHKILASSLACIAMFLIGAPLGAIIKKGGLGVPFLVSIIFFIIYYLLSMQGEKLAKQGAVSAAVGIWAADVILLVIGLLFLRQARVDARLFDADFYRIVIDRLKQRWFSKRLQPKPAS